VTTSALILGRVLQCVLEAHFPDSAETLPEDQSPWSSDRESLDNELQRHFIEQLPKHCRLLLMAMLDAGGVLASIEETSPFSGTVLARGLLEAAGDLHWLVQPDIDPQERARRSLTIYLEQVESSLRKLMDARDRGAPISDDASRDQAIEEGHEMLALYASEARAAGYEVTRTRRPGAMYVLGDGKPSATALVDDVVTEFHGQTVISPYRMHSSAAHGTGEGLGALMDLTDSIETDAGTLFAWGFTRERWASSIDTPAANVLVGTASEVLAYLQPSQVAAFRLSVAQTRLADVTP
jgi:hypothetical protein